MSTRERIIIALHGAGMRADAWEALAQRLPSGQAFLPLSLPGHDRSDKEALLSSIESMAGWLEKQMESHASRSVVLMGHSMGALVALEAARHPAVAALVLIGAAAQMPVHPDLLKQAAVAPEVAAGLILKWGVSSAHPEATEIVKQHMYPEALANDLSACDSYRRGMATAQAIDKPVLVIAGGGDKMTKPAAGKALADMIKNAQFRVMPGSGHMLMIEDPVETAREFNTFLALIEG